MLPLRLPKEKPESSPAATHRRELEELGGPVPGGPMSSPMDRSCERGAPDREAHELEARVLSGAFSRTPSMVLSILSSLTLQVESL